MVTIGSPRPMRAVQRACHQAALAGRPGVKDGGSGAHCQVAGHGEWVRRQGAQPHQVAPVGEESPLGTVDAAGVFGEDGRPGRRPRLGRRRVMPAQPRAGGGRSAGRQRWWSWAGLRRGERGRISAGERCAIKVIIARRMDVRKMGARGPFRRRLPAVRGRICDTGCGFTAVPAPGGSIGPCESACGRPDSTADLSIGIHRNGIDTIPMECIRNGLDW